MNYDHSKARYETKLADLNEELDTVTEVQRIYNENVDNQGDDFEATTDDAALDGKVDNPADK